MDVSLVLASGWKPRTRASASEQIVVNIEEVSSSCDRSWGRDPMRIPIPCCSPRRMRAGFVNQLIDAAAEFELQGGPEWH